VDTSFTGQADYTLDAKNRLTVPARYRDRFSDGVVVAKDIEACVAIWSVAGYAEFCEQALGGANPMGAQARKVRAFLAANAIQGELDGAGRIALQPFLMEHGTLDREVTVAGVGDHLQVWNRHGWTTYNQQLAGDMASIALAFDSIGQEGRGAS
jgi:MraZ protein